MNESATDGFVTEIALAGAIPTEIGRLARLTKIVLFGNQLTGACRETSLGCNSYSYLGKRVHH